MTEPIVFNGVVIAELCRYCKGDGRITLEDRKKQKCPYCSGVGTTVTDEGFALREFALRHLSVGSSLRAK